MIDSKTFDETDSGPNYVFRLFVSGMTPRSAQALATTRAMCEQHLAGRYDLQIIDIYQNPEMASAEQIVAVPTLVKKLPAPLRRFIGDLSDGKRLLSSLGIVG